MSLGNKACPARPVPEVLHVVGVNAVQDQMSKDKNISSVSYHWLKNNNMNFSAVCMFITVESVNNSPSFFFNIYLHLRLNFHENLQHFFLTGLFVNQSKCFMLKLKVISKDYFFS